jgi:hypothetical protein
MLEAKIQRPWKFSAAAPAIGGERTRKGYPSIGRPPRASFHPLPAKLGQEEQQLGWEWIGNRLWPTEARMLMIRMGEAAAGQK